jgi:cell division protein FtsB
MDDNTRLEEIKKRVTTGGYLANAAADIEFLLEQLEKFHKKNEILAQHNLELTQEMENIKSDFGGGGR